MPGSITSDVSAASEATGGDASVEQPLQTPWTFWFDRLSPEPYCETLQRLGTVHSVQGFWRYYCNLTRPGQLQPGDNYHLFRGALTPALESIPGGGCWMYKLERAVDSEPAGRNVEIDQLWEQLLLSLVGETVGEPCVVGAGVSVRQREVALSVWCEYDGDAESPSRVGSALANLFADTNDGRLQWRDVPTSLPRRARSSAHGNAVLS